MQQPLQVTFHNLPHSDAPFVMIFPKETTEAFCLGHAEAFTWFGDVPRTILYDHTATVK